MKKVSLRYLSQEDILSLNLTAEAIVAAVERVILSHGKGLVQLPPKPGIFPRKGKYNYFHAMPAFVEDLDICGLKWLGRVTLNPQENDLPQFTGLQVVNDPETGVPLAVMDCRWITVARTTALSVVTARHLSPPAPKAMAIVGAGLQARFHALMFASEFPSLEKIYINSRTAQSVDRFVKDMEAMVPVKIIPSSAEEACRNSQIIVSAGVRDPLYKLRWISPGTLCIGLDLLSSWGREIQEGVDKVFVDDEKQFRDRYVTEPQAFAGEPRVTAELGKVLTGRAPGRESPEERILSLNVGMGVCDLALGDLIYREAGRQNKGTVLPLMEREDIWTNLEIKNRDKEMVE